MPKVAVVVIVVVTIVWLFAEHTRRANFAGMPRAMAPSESEAEDPEQALPLPLARENAVPSQQGAVIAFPNGHEIEVEFRDLPYGAFTPVGRLPDVYDPLADRADQGDGAAALRLHHLLAACADAYTNPEELESVIDKMYQTRTVDLHPSRELVSAEPMIDGDVDLGMYESVLRQNSADCSSMTDDQLAGADDWLFRAVELGDTRAVMWYAQTLLIEQQDDAGNPEHRMEVIHAFEQAWLQGSVYALQHLWSLYASGSLHIARDSTKAYAYIWLNTYLRIAQIRRDDRFQADIVERLVRGKLGFLEEQAMRMPSWEVDEAMNMAEQLLKENDGCCLARH